MRYCRFPRAALRTLLDDFPLMEKRLLEVASNELVAAQEQMLLLGRKTARERLASFLLAQSRQGMPSGHSRQRFRLPMTRIDIADYLGLTIETVSRTFTRLRAEGLIDIVSQSGLVICDPVCAGEPGGRPALLRRLRARGFSHQRQPDTRQRAKQLHATLRRQGSAERVLIGAHGIVVTAAACVEGMAE